MAARSAYCKVDDPSGLRAGVTTAQEIPCARKAPRIRSATFRSCSSIEGRAGAGSAISDLVERTCFFLRV
jgi:hypothetical protein